ncbi:MAG: PIN domain-containing protein [Woeseiaceae bacterium]
MKHLFVDSNLFLQCQDLKSLAWREIIKDEDILLLIPAAVQREIDSLKSDGNKRRAKRARTTNSLFRKVILSENTKTKISSRSPKIELTVSPQLPPIEQSPEIELLDPSKPDDAIMLELLAYRQAFPDTNAAILTHDTIPLLTAKRLGIPFEVIPDSWLLNPENDDKDKKINHLEQQIKEILKNFPIIELSAYVDDIEQNSLKGEIIEYPELTTNEIDLLLDKIKLSNPMKTDFDSKQDENEHKATTRLSSSFFSGRYTPPSHEDVTKYTKETYPEWLDASKKSLVELPASLNNKNNLFKISIKMNNTGNVPANNTLINFSVSDSLLLSPQNEEDEEDEEKDSIWSIPSPPVAPSGQYISGMDTLLGNMGSLAHLVDAHPALDASFFNPIPKHRDRNAFYWKPRRPITTEQYQELECEEFPHKIREETFNLRIIALESHKPTGGLITCTVSAKNLKEPVELTIPVKLSFKKESTFEIAKYLIGQC